MVSFSIFKGKEEAEGLKRVKDLCFIESAITSIVPSVLQATNTDWSKSVVERCRAPQTPVCAPCARIQFASFGQGTKG